MFSRTVKSFWIWVNELNECTIGVLLLFATADDACKPAWIPDALSNAFYINMYSMRNFHTDSEIYTIKLSTNFVINYVTSYVGVHFNFTEIKYIRTHLPFGELAMSCASIETDRNSFYRFKSHTHTHTRRVCFYVNSFFSRFSRSQWDSLKLKSHRMGCVWYDFRASMHTQSQRNHLHRTVQEKATTTSLAHMIRSIRDGSLPSAKKKSFSTFRSRIQTMWWKFFVCFWFAVFSHIFFFVLFSKEVFISKRNGINSFWQFN